MTPTGFEPVSGSLPKERCRSWAAGRRVTNTQGYGRLDVLPNVFVGLHALPPALATSSDSPYSQRMGMGADLVLLAIDDTRGGIRNAAHVARAVAAAELIELAAAGCLGLRGGHLTVMGTGDASNPDSADVLVQLAKSRRPETVARWLGHRGGPARVRDCITELEHAGVVAVDDTSRNSAGKPAMHVHLSERAVGQAAVDRLIGIARGTLTSAVDEAFAALADAAGLARPHLRGFSNRHARDRISTLTARRAQTPAEPDRTVLAIARAAVHAMAEVARRARLGGSTDSMAIPIEAQFVMQPEIQRLIQNQQNL